MRSAFAVVPVLDLMGGLVVHARAGERDRYRPLARSRVAATAEPAAVVRGLLDLFPFETLYIADLDAIRGRGDHRAVIRALRREFPDLELWIDAGFADRSAFLACRAERLGRLVLGSESQRDLGLLRAVRAAPDVVLSLDFKGEDRLGPPELFEWPDLWPERIIVMTLGRVGSGEGPDHERLAKVRDRAPEKLVHAAGGVRDAGDLEALRALGCAGALVASALHDGRLTGEDLARLAG